MRYHTCTLTQVQHLFTPYYRYLMIQGTANCVLGVAVRRVQFVLLLPFCKRWWRYSCATTAACHADCHATVRHACRLLVVLWCCGVLLAWSTAERGLVVPRKHPRLERPEARETCHGATPGGTQLKSGGAPRNRAPFTATPVFICMGLVGPIELSISLLGSLLAWVWPAKGPPPFARRPAGGCRLEARRRRDSSG